MTQWVKTKWQSWLIRQYKNLMTKHQMMAEYNLHRHEEALDMYVQKKAYRSMHSNENGHYISPEGADKFVEGHNYHWELYIKYKQKIAALNATYANEE